MKILWSWNYFSYEYLTWGVTFTMTLLAPKVFPAWVSTTNFCAICQNRICAQCSYNLSLNPLCLMLHKLSTYVNRHLSIRENAVSIMIQERKNNLVIYKNKTMFFLFFVVAPRQIPVHLVRLWIAFKILLPLVHEVLIQFEQMLVFIIQRLSKHSKAFVTLYHNNAGCNWSNLQITNNEYAIEWAPHGMQKLGAI